MPKRQLYRDDMRGFFENLPLLAPQKIFDLLSKHHYKGQEFARKAIALMAYRHVRRLKRIYLDGVARETLPPKSNYLLIGPTGCGKTFLVELLFRKILNLPTVVVDVTNFSETGYVGNDPVTILTMLLHAANDNPVLASAGVVCLDEFDKLATTQNQARFDGQGTTKDVSGYGVQKELLRMLEAGTVQVPTDYNNTSYGYKVDMRTDDVAFIACGAFSGFKGIAALGPTIGFMSPVKADAGGNTRSIAVTYDEAEVSNIEHFARYGFIPELMGRFTRIIPLSPLSRDTLREILVDSVVKKFQSEFSDEAIELSISSAVLDHIVETSFKRQTGARGLASVLTKYLEDAAFAAFSSNVHSIRLKMVAGQVVTDMA